MGQIPRSTEHISSFRGNLLQLPLYCKSDLLLLVTLPQTRKQQS